MSSEKTTFPLPKMPFCRWYYRGATNTEPRTAIVHPGNRNDGVLDLLVTCRNVTNLTTLSGVRHKDDPYLVSHPTYAKENGCWDYWPGDEPEELAAPRSVGTTYRKETKAGA
jgi:hypothetical protein